MKNMKNWTISGIAAGCLLVLMHATPAAAQWSLEGRIGSAVPTGALAEEPTPNQTAGFSFAADAMYTFTTNLTAYAGATRESFNCDGCTADVVSAGFEGGLKFLFPNNSSATPWVRGGLIYNRSSVDTNDYDWGLGVDSGAGIDWRVSNQLSVVPAVRLNSYSSGPISLTYVTMDLGLHLHMND